MNLSSSAMQFSRPCKTTFAAFSTAVARDQYECFEPIEERFEGEEEEH
jgi:hypothetical protein